MHYRFLEKHHQATIRQLFTSVFAAAYDQQEGRLVGKLAGKLSAECNHQDIIGIGAIEAEQPIAAIFFSRLTFDDESRIYLLAPLAVSTQHQGQGVGQGLINYGLQQLKQRSVIAAITYGDPKFYGRLGFQPLSEAVIQAPLTLSMPEGWLGLSLTTEPIPNMKTRPRCVEPFNDPVYW